MRLQYSSLPNVFLESFILYTAGQTLEKIFFFLFAWSVVQDTRLTGGAQPLAVGGSVRAQVSLLTPRSPVQRLNRHLMPACNATAPPLSRRTLLGSGLTLWPRTEMPRVPHTVPVPKGLRACPAPAADLPACGSPASPALSGSVPGGIDYLRVWWERGLRGPPEASGACGIHRSLCSWGFLPFFWFSASLFGLPCSVFALATYFNKLSSAEKVFVVTTGSRKQFLCVSENTAIRKAHLLVGTMLGCSEM